VCRGAGWIFSFGCLSALPTMHRQWIIDRHRVIWSERWKRVWLQGWQPVKLLVLREMGRNWTNVWRSRVEVVKSLNMLWGKQLWNTLVKRMFARAACWETVVWRHCGIHHWEKVGEGSKFRFIMKIHQQVEHDWILVLAVLCHAIFVVYAARWAWGRRRQTMRISCWNQSCRWKVNRTQHICHHNNPPNTIKRKERDLRR